MDDFRFTKNKKQKTKNKKQKTKNKKQKTKQIMSSMKGEIVVVDLDDDFEELPSVMKDNSGGSIIVDLDDFPAGLCGNTKWIKGFCSC